MLRAQPMRRFLALLGGLLVLVVGLQAVAPDPIDGPAVAKADATLRR